MMPRLKQLLIATACCVATQTVHGQGFHAPSGYILEHQEDYAEYEADVIRCIDWLEATAVAPNTIQQKEAKKFLIAWLAGSPNVTIEVNAAIVNFTDKNPDLLITFMGGWTKLVLEHPEYQHDPVKGNVAGLQSVIRVYKRGQGIKKDKNVERLLRLEQEGQLESWVQERLKAIN